MRFSRLALVRVIKFQLAIALLLGAFNVPVGASRITASFDAGWRFSKGDQPGAESTSFDDKSWGSVDLPHDWSIEGPFDQANKTGPAGGFLPAGTGWYRKHFSLNSQDAGRRVFVEFDGMMANSQVWINGVDLGKRPYGYVSFVYELTDKAKVGDKIDNVIAVRVDDSAQPASRWYSGAGIYRHVRLVTTDPVHIEHWSTFVSTPRVSAASATVQVEGTVLNQSDTKRSISISSRLYDSKQGAAATGKPSELVVGPNGSATFKIQIELPRPDLWDIDNPRLYRAVTTINVSGRTVDSESTPFGIRQAEFRADTGFWLNGRNLKIKGVCLHADGGAFGAAVPLSVWRHRLTVLRELGVNAIRTAHNPPAPEFLDLCDQMGFLVMDEMFDVWTVAKNPFDYHLYFRDWSIRDTVDTVRRDRNHPSVIIYSAGNEIHDTPNAPLAKEILRSLVDAFHATDPTRPVTQALFRPNVSHDYDNGLADMLDVVGQNYRENEILAAHQQKPSRKILGTENTHDRNMWLAMRDHPEYAGQFIWSGIDYLGESQHWPVTSNNAGLLDRTGTPRPVAFERQSWWSDRPMVFAARRVAVTPKLPTDPGYDPAGDRRPQVLFPDWSPDNREPHEESVEVYSNCQTVELFLNGKSLGKKERPRDDSPRVWKVEFQPGTLKSVGYNSGKVAAQQELATAGPPARVQLVVDRKQIAPTWDDVAFITATIVDANGIAVPGTSNLVRFSVVGPGRIAATDSGNLSSHESFQAPERHAWQGRCIGIVKATSGRGPIIVRAQVDGLTDGEVRLEVVASKKD